MRAKDAWDRAAECAAKIKATTDPAERQFLIHMRNGWIEMANQLASLEGGIAPQVHENGSKQTV